MRAVRAVVLVAVLAVSGLVSAACLDERSCQADELPEVQDQASESVMAEAVQYAHPIDTLTNLTEYPLISRALILPGGSTDAVLGDINGDGLSDLMVGVSEPNCISIFYRKSDGNLSSMPSHNITLERTPIAVATIDSFNNASLQIVVLEQKSGVLDSDHLKIFNYTSEDSYAKSLDTIVSDNARQMVVGQFVGEVFPDIALVCEGPNPGLETGVVEIRRGPLFASVTILECGNVPSSLSKGDFDNDDDLDIAVCNLLDSSVMTFHQPFTNGMSPNLVISVEGEPTDIISGNLSGDGFEDIAVVTQYPAAVRLFFQTQVGEDEWSLPSVENLNLTLSYQPSGLACGDLNADSLQDLVVLSTEKNRTIGVYQGMSHPRWSSDQSFEFPTGAHPRNALIASLDSDDHVDLAISSARSDWSGSSIALYIGGQGDLSNSNKTTWTSAQAVATMFSVGDLNKDDTDDLILLCPGDEMLRYDLSFSSLLYEHPLGYVPGDLTVADFNSDGYDDILVSEAGGPALTFCFGSSSPEAGLTDTSIAASGTITAIGTGDLSGDGLLDLAAATAEGGLDIFVNTGSESDPFTSAQLLSPTSGVGIASIAIDDFDSDGLADLAFTNTSRSLCSIDILLQSDEDPRISLPCDLTLEMSVVDHFGKIWSGDVTGDYRSDLSAMRPTDPRFYIFDQSNFETTEGPDTVFDLPEVPTFVGVLDATDDERCDLLVTYASADLLYLHKQQGETIPSSPSMVFVTGAFPNQAMMGDATGDHRMDLLVNDAGSMSVSAWQLQVYDFGPVAGMVLSSNPPVEGEPFSFVSTTYSYDAIVTWIWTLTYPGGATQQWFLNASEMQALEFDSLDDGSYTMALWVEEWDGDTDLFELAFEVEDSAPSVDMQLLPAESWYQEFQDINFTATAESYDQVAGYEWDFRTEGAGFIPDRATLTGYTTYQYNWSGSFTAAVRVTDSDGSQVVASVLLEVRDTPIDVLFDDYVQVEKNPNLTREVLFDASELALAFPDIVTSLWEFGDGTTMTEAGLSSDAVTHAYDPTRDYQVNLTVTDDDLNSYVLSKQLFLKHPTIVLISPHNGAVLAPGQLLQFAIRDDSLPLVSVTYSLGGGVFQDFETMYEISTEGWQDGTYSIIIKAEDKDGNVAMTEEPIAMTIDSVDPVAALVWSTDAVYGGDKIEVLVEVEDENVGPGSVVLYVKYPGGEEFSGVIMTATGPSTYHATVEIPLRSGTLEIYATVTDLAGHSSSTETRLVTVKLHFIDAAWPFLLVAAVLVALGTGAYFVRESKLAVDETFVIYNDGRLISHSTRRLKPGMDDQILGGMLMTIQEFVRDSFKDETSFTLRKLTFGDRNILIEKGRHLHLAVVLHGKESRKVASRMERVVKRIEREYGERIADWNGDLDKVRGVNEMVKRLYSKAPGLFRK